MTSIPNGVRAIARNCIASCLLTFAAATAGGPLESPKTYTVLISGFKFTPEKLTVHAGDTVIWKNEDLVPHTATGKKFDSKGLDKGQSWSYVAKQKGSFPYICRYHPTMTAELIVQ